jgi:hypothetical protein
VGGFERGSRIGGQRKRLRLAEEESKRRALLAKTPAEREAERSLRGEEIGVRREELAQRKLSAQSKQSVDNFLEGYTKAALGQSGLEAINRGVPEAQRATAFTVDPETGDASISFVSGQSRSIPFDTVSKLIPSFRKGTTGTTFEEREVVRSEKKTEAERRRISNQVRTLTEQLPLTVDDEERAQIRRDIADLQSQLPEFKKLTARKQETRRKQLDKEITAKRKEVERLTKESTEGGFLKLKKQTGREKRKIAEATAELDALIEEANTLKKVPFPARATESLAEQLGLGGNPTPAELIAAVKAGKLTKAQAEQIGTEQGFE